LASEALRAAQVPTLMLNADMVNTSNWDRDAAVGLVEDFLRREVQSREVTK
jgi:hypothetical protein